MAISNIKALIPCDVKKVWDTVTSLDQYEWRSDLSKIEVIDENQSLNIRKTVCNYIYDYCFRTMQTMGI